MNIFKFITKFTLGGQMSEQGADAAGMELYKGFKFLLIALGISGGLALLFWRLPDLAQFIITLKNS
ncbi:hypothetical protein A4G17_01950 [Frederiksenia canicola]|uniref:Uncharacterized protein n=2 Tax=Frederiksenia canicola TaxID=123824 RepID=A0AAE6X4T5_9PAST|nr:hypothetical protein A4G17_01950 [Frederiksenia canicola]RPE93848.1 hypothetical protein EDC49_1363 [Frederiksenia canicola]